MLRRIGLVLLALVLALGAYYSFPQIADQPRAVLAIMVAVGTLWFTEAIPLFLTSLLIPFILAIFAGFSPAKVYAPFFDPIIALLLGGFVIARALQKHGLDYEMAAYIVKRVGNNPRFVLLGIISITAFISMWISNTATAAMMMPIGLAIITANKLKPLKSGFAKAVVIGVGYAATIGGLGTLVGTPPNAITAGFLGKAGITVNFMDWMVAAIPLMIIMILLCWLVLCFLFKPELKETVPIRARVKKFSRNQEITFAVFVLTVALWMTEVFHGIHYSLIALVPVLLLFGLEVLGKEDVEKLGWESLLLVGGGLCLGMAIQGSGLDAILAGALGGLIAGQGVFVSLLALTLFLIGFTAFIANTAATAIMVPVLIPVASMLGLGIRPVALLAGMVSSFDFLVPVGTPPNVIAYNTGYIRVKDMVKAGILLSLTSAVVVSLFAMFWW
jgi:sodium-dependent dicarboxylate transporter 2/3/5